ncbi:MAG: thymidine kinase [Actinomycetes bacterium]
MAELVFFTGTMDCGKSTLAAQVNYNHVSRGRRGLVFTRNDRAGSGILSSRLGLTVEAHEVTDETDFFASALEGRRETLDYIICDESQFYTRIQIDQLAHIVDDLDIDVYAFGITSDFRTTLFPGSARLIELADRIETLQVEALCWCGRKGTHNARTINGVMVTEGEQVVVGDTSAQTDVVGYEVLCRRHHMQGMTLQNPGD